VARSLSLADKASGFQQNIFAHRQNIFASVVKSSHPAAMSTKHLRPRLRLDQVIQSRSRRDTFARIFGSNDLSQAMSTKQFHMRLQLASSEREEIYRVLKLKAAVASIAARIPDR
jgi:hypothetical protein